MPKRHKPTGFLSRDESDKRLARKRAIRERAKAFKKAKPIPEDQLRELIAAHMAAHGVVVCPPAYAAPTRALDGPQKPKSQPRGPKRTP